MKQGIAILGSTGSIGLNTLDVVSRSLKDSFEVIALSADSNIKLLSEQAKLFRAKAISVRDSLLASAIKKSVSKRTEVLTGLEGLNAIVSRHDVDIVVFAISGSSCVIPLLKAIENKKKIALANKESLVAAGAIVMKQAKKSNSTIIPIDSEHSAIFQCLDGRADQLNKIYLTGSGGPLLDISPNRFDGLSKEFILKHPKWKMGRKISVDSATMMNKGLEIIEARWLFGVEEDRIEVLIHPEAVIHSMVELVDGVIFAELGAPDMRSPIQYALTYPSRSKGLAPMIDFSKITKFSFRQPDIDKFPCLDMARWALKMGGTLTAVLNAADEEAVKGFLKGDIRFSAIPRIIEKVMSKHKNISKNAISIDDVLGAEAWAREETRSLCYH